MNVHYKTSVPQDYSTINEAKDREFHTFLDVVLHKLALCSAASLLAICLGLFVALVYGSLPSIQHSGTSFFLSASWNPAKQEFGALSSLYGTLVSSAIALGLAIPLSLLIAAFLVQVASPFLSRILGTTIDLLAAIPSIIFGVWGLFIFAPFSAKYLQPSLAALSRFVPFFQGAPSGIGLLSAGMILALMILPLMTSIMKDAFRMTPPLLQEAAYGLGATDWEVMKDVNFRYAWRGLIGACLLGTGRALGETMAVAFVIGNSSTISASLFAPANTMSSRLVNEFIEAADSLHISALMELGLVLLMMSFVLQVMTQLWLQRMRGSAGGSAQ